MIYKTNIFVILYLLCINTIYAQDKTSQVKGYVKDNYGRPIAGAVISVLEPKSMTISDSDGFYKIDKLPLKTIILKVSCLGYLEHTHQIKTEINKPYIHDVVLNESNQSMKEITVIGQSANKEKINEIQRSGFNVDVIDMSKYANQTANVNQILKTASGITFREDGGLGSNFIFKINGLDAKIYIDGVPMENFGNSMTLNNIPVNLIDRVEIYKGVVPAFLGSDALGGAVNIITKQRNRHFLDLSQSFGSFNTYQTALVGMYTNPKNKLSVKVNGFYNHSDNDYTMYSNEAYNVILEKTENNKYVPVDKVKRFYDKYSSGMGQVEVGLRDKKWADQFFVGLTYSENHKQNQLGVTINSVNGGSWSESKYLMPTISYKKQNFFIDRLYADVYASTSYDVIHVRDTALYNYDWSGHWVGNALASNPKIPVNTRFNSQNYLARFNFNYDFDEDRNQSINLNYNFNNSQRKTYDFVSENNLTGLPSRLARHIVGLSWQSQFFEKRLVNNLAIKFYGLDTYRQLDERVYNSNHELISGAITKYGNFFGYYSASLASRYRLTKDGGVKFSLERAYNMPNITGLLGDGQNTIGNWDLKPERSDNLNVGYYINSNFKESHFLNLDISGFYRLAKDYLNIKTVAQDGTNYFQYENVPGVKLYGFEAEIKYGYKDIIAITLNGTYDKAIHNNKYTDETNQQVNLSYGHQLENRPCLYGNGEIMLAKNDVFKKGNRMQFSWNYQYTKWFYLTLAHLGSLATKDYIPSQNIHSATLSYSWKRNKYNISFEGRNLTDERAYDNFRLQKPGIAFYTKFRISIM